MKTWKHMTKISELAVFILPYDSPTTLKNTTEFNCIPAINYSQ